MLDVAVIRVFQVEMQGLGGCAGPMGSGGNGRSYPFIGPYLTCTGHEIDCASATSESQVRGRRIIESGRHE